jgi:hypothetical protein
MCHFVFFLIKYRLIKHSPQQNRKRELDASKALIAGYDEKIGRLEERAVQAELALSIANEAQRRAGMIVIILCTAIIFVSSYLLLSCVRVWFCRVTCLVIMQLLISIFRGRSKLVSAAPTCQGVLCSVVGLSCCANSLSSLSLGGRGVGCWLV